MAKLKLLNVEGDAKTKKGSRYGVLTAILYLAPAMEADGVHNLCGSSTAECRQACLYGAGMAQVFPHIKEQRIEKTRWYLADRTGFMAQLRHDIEKLLITAKARGMEPAVRINGTSDQPQIVRDLAPAFPEVQFYDYTKIPKPWKRQLPNYHLTFSFSGENLAECMESLKHGVNVAVVFPSADFPATWQGYKVVDGDVNDLRFRDPRGVIVGLKAKGDARKLAVGGFVQIAKVS